MSDAVQVALIVAAVPAVFGIVQTIIMNRHTRQLAQMQADAAKTQTAIEETNAAIVTLEKNTNSIKDELVRVTRNEALWEGAANEQHRAAKEARTEAERNTERGPR